MKKFLLVLLVTVLFLTNWFRPAAIHAQAPKKISYQAVIRNSDNALVINAVVGMQISILQGSAIGTTVYQETQTPTTNFNGLLTIEIGDGKVTTGNFSSINWAVGPYFIKTESDLSGGTNYTISGTQALLSVPYALYAESSGSSLPGPQGAAGNNGVDGKTVLNGTSNPTASIGTNGDFYLNTATTQLFGPKTSGAWGSGKSLIGASGGGITSLSIVSANGLAGTVANPTTTPAITLNTSVTGILKGNGTAISAATAPDFPVLNQNTTGNAATVTTNANLTGPVTSVGNATAIGAGVITTAMLAAVNSNIGTFNNVTVNNKGQVTAASNVTYETPLTFSTGLTRTTNTITNNLATGKAGSQTVIGGTAASENLTLSSTSNATKGKILFGTSAYSEFNNRLGIGTITPAASLDVVGAVKITDGTQGIGKVLTSDANGLASWQTASSGGGVTNVSIVSANGFAGTVANSGTTPAITLTTPVTGI